MTTPDLKTTMALLSALVHADEMVAYLGPSNPSHVNAFEADKEAFLSAISQIKPLLAEYDAMSLLPIRRDGVRYGKEE